MAISQVASGRVFCRESNSLVELDSGAARTCVVRDPVDPPSLHRTSSVFWRREGWGRPPLGREWESDSKRHGAPVPSTIPRWEERGRRLAGGFVPLSRAPHTSSLRG